jgi:hypothetical protein
MTLFEYGAQIATDTAKGRDPCFTAKGSRDLLLHFDHAHIKVELFISLLHGLAWALLHDCRVFKYIVQVALMEESRTTRSGFFEALDTWDGELDAPEKKLFVQACLGGTNLVCW